MTGPGPGPGPSGRRARRETRREGEPGGTERGGDRPTRLWFLITALSVGGTERTLVDLANGLDPAEYDVTVWTLFDENPLADDLRPHVGLRTLGVTGETAADGAYVESVANRRSAALAPLKLAAALRRERPDVLQSFLVYDNVLARLAGVASPETTVVSGVRSVPDDRPWWHEVPDRLTLPLADRVVSNSRAGARFVEARGVDPDDVTVVHNGRDVDAFAGDGESSEVGDADSVGTSDGTDSVAAGDDTDSVAAGETADDPPRSTEGDGPRVGTVGRLIERKGHYDLLRAWPAVLDAHPDATLVFVGDGPEREGLARTATDLGVDESVAFLGFRDDVPRLLHTFDVFAFPSHFEGLPGALLEAMAAGRPIVATAVDGSAELVSNYREGLHVATEAPDELAAAVSLLLANPALADELGENARRRARSEFTVERMVEEFEAFYRRLRPTDDRAPTPRSPATDSTKST